MCTPNDELRAVLRARADELRVSRETIDAVSGLADGYASKVLAPVPMKGLGRISMGPILETLGLALVVVENPEAVERHCHRLVPRVEHNVRTRTLRRPSAECRRGRVRRTGDPALGEFADAVVLQKFGDAPDDLSEL